MGFKTKLMALIGAGAMALPALAQTYNEYVNEVASTISSEYGMQESHARQSAYMGSGQSANFAVNLTGGTDYAFVGVCDGDCSDVDLTVSFGGQVIQEDTASDDVPVLLLSPSSDGQYLVNAAMYDCATGTCQITILFFRN